MDIQMVPADIHIAPVGIDNMLLGLQNVPAVIHMMVTNKENVLADIQITPACKNSGFGLKIASY